MLCVGVVLERKASISPESTVKLREPNTSLQGPWFQRREEAISQISVNVLSRAPVCACVYRVLRWGAQLRGRQGPECSCWATMQLLLMVNFMCPLDWARGCPDIWPHVILWGTFWMKLTFESVEWVKQIALPNVGALHLIRWRPE